VTSGASVKYVSELIKSLFSNRLYEFLTKKEVLTEDTENTEKIKKIKRLLLLCFFSVSSVFFYESYWQVKHQVSRLAHSSIRAWPMACPCG